MKVQVYAYDLTRGMAASLSPMLLGYQIEAVWHTGVVLDGRQEVFFGYGIMKARAGATMFGTPARVFDMGESEVTPELVDDLLSDLQPSFRPQDYNLLFHNCNTFSNELVQLLTGESLPDYIMEQAQHLFNTPWGESLMPMIMAMEGVTGGATAQGHAAAQIHQQQQQQQQPQQQQQQQPAAASAGPSSGLTARAASASAAAVEATTHAASAAAGCAQQSTPGAGVGEVGASDGQAAAAGAASAAANAGMAAIVREAKQEQQHAAAPCSTSSSDRMEVGHEAAAPAGAAAVQKATEGVAGLQLTADSRAVQQQD